jgi:hypothetical protein
MFASPISHVGGSGSTVAPTHAYGSSLGPDPLVYSQNPDYNGAYSSQNDTNGFGNFATAYDNFTLGATYNITEFAWVGSYFNPPQQGLITGATLTFYADAGGAPGAVLWQRSGSGNFGETFLGFDNVGDPTYLYDGLLGTPFVAQAGTTYWVSIVPDLGFPPQWGWETATGGDGAAYQCFFGTCGAIPNDVSFALYGNQTTTPEPSALILFGSGLVGLGSLRRRLR